MADKSRGLTPGEISVAESVFGNSIDYSKVRIHDGKIPGFLDSKFQPDTLPVPYDADNIYAPPKVYSDDMSTGSKGDFIHLMAYVWQFQNGVTTPDAVKAWGKANFSKLDEVSQVTPDPSKDLKDYNVEQRARLIQDLYYYRNSQSPPQPPDPDGSLFLKQYGAAIEKNPNDPFAKMFVNSFGITKGADGQLHVDPKKWAQAQANMKTQQAADAQEQQNTMKVLSKFVADPSYLNPNHPAAAPAAPAPAKSKTPAPA